MIEELENKYIDLILNKCLNFSYAKSLFIDVSLAEHLPFAQKIKAQAAIMGIEDVEIHCRDLFLYRDYLAQTELDDIKLNSLLDFSLLDKYAKKGAAILFLKTEIPNLMEGIDPCKIAKANAIIENTRKYYRQNVTSYIFPWSIVALPNKYWAQQVFPNDIKALERLYLAIFKACMINTDNPICSWDNFITINNKIKNALNELGILQLHYTNRKGTDFSIGVNPQAKWLNLDKLDANGNPFIANMPSYEIFTTPNCFTANGILYSSKPLVFKGNIIDEFWLKFKDGEVVDFDAKIGQEYLASLLTNYKNSRFLGEVALVPNDSNIAQMNIVFRETLYDENSSCHFALGSGNKRAFGDYSSNSPEELAKLGLNISDVHVDFMIGTEDLDIEAITNKGRIRIFKNGKFNI